MDITLRKLKAAARRNPCDPQLAHALGSTFFELGRHRKALKWLKRATKAAKDDLTIRQSLTKTLLALGMAPRAAEQLEKSVAASPLNVELKLLLGDVYTGMPGGSQRASSLFCKMIEDVPECKAAYHALARLYVEDSTPAAAAKQMLSLLRRRDLSLHMAEALCSALEHFGRYEELIGCCHDLLKLYSSNILGLVLRARANVALGNVHEATQDYVLACRLGPGDEIANLDYLRHLLRLGMWRDAQTKFRASLQQRSSNTIDAKRDWDGSRAVGARLLIDTLTGHGDLIQFSRFAALAHEEHLRVIVRCPAILAELLSTVPSITKVVPRYESCPGYDYRTQASHLGILLARDWNSIGDCVPYVHVPATVRDRWARRLGTSRNELRVGICWAGGSLWQSDPYRARSVPFETFARITEAIPNVKTYSLQVGSVTTDILFNKSKIENLGAQVQSFMDTAAAMLGLDLIITVDTAVAHLAGAMNIPCFVLLPVYPCWRWGISSRTTAWYPSMRLFRQTRPGCWQDVVNFVRDEVANKACSRFQSNQRASVPRLA